MEIFKELDPTIETVGLLLLSDNITLIKDHFIIEMDEMGLNGHLIWDKYLPGYHDYLTTFQKYRINTEYDIDFSKYSMNLFLDILFPILSRKDFFEGYLAQATVADLRSKFVKYYNSFYESEIPFPQESTMEDVYLFVSNIDDLESDDRWPLITLLHDPLAFYNRLGHMLKANIAVFEKVCEECQDYVTKGLPDLKDTEAVYRSFIDHVSSIRPMAFLPATFIAINDNAMLGIYSNDITSLLYSIDSHVEPLATALKPFGDKSKLEILSLINKEPLYGAQIAQKLKLTAATVSYHLNNLLSHNMIIAELSDGKLYYTPNHKYLQKLLQQLESLIL